MPRMAYWNILLLSGLVTLVSAPPSPARAADRETLKPRARESGNPAVPSLQAEVRRIHTEHETRVRQFRASAGQSGDRRTRTAIQREIETLHLAREVRLLELQRAHAVAAGDVARRERLERSLRHMPESARRLAAQFERGGQR